MTTNFEELGLCSSCATSWMARQLEPFFYCPHERVLVVRSCGSGGVTFDAHSNVSTQRALEIARELEHQAMYTR